jgi:hypothetical protein
MMLLDSWLAGTFCRFSFRLRRIPSDIANTMCSFYEALLIPFEISAFTLVLSFWSDKITEPGPVAGICAAVIFIYG